MTGLVSLPMYDWPEVSAALDRLWAAIRSSLTELGVEAPTQRDRSPETIEQWRDSSLLLGQTCGLPLRRYLTDQVAVVGTFDHRLRDTRAGSYHSVIIVGADHPATSIADLDAATAAINAADSQSGHAALRHALIAAPGAVGTTTRSGSHRRSIEFVADGRADVAAIDAVSWELALAHEPAAARCRVLERTAPTPGLPLVTAQANRGRLPELRLAVAHGLQAVDAAARTALHAHALIPATADDYTMLDDRWREADRAGVVSLA